MVLSLISWSLLNDVTVFPSHCIVTAPCRFHALSRYAAVYKDYTFSLAPNIKLVL
jgi:hypothetical protein